ncbi:ABC transporter permease [Parablautia muri]|uniref:ABC transporter permease n=1 Tax=Parablautia muri TaxID=2320879 RepID=A0A9X5BEX8_9FIRM|nr:ABC transporter permease [Parablautia muri]NBJ92776.1 ABC transporter permease [Parablautia muri]
MLKLIRLEWKKNNIMKYMWKALAMVIILLLLLLTIAGELEAAETRFDYGNSMLKSGVELFTNMSFIILTCVMLASFIVGTYKNKTINLMFSYPINRKKIVLSQMLSVWIFNFIALTLSKVLIYCVLVAVKKYTFISAEGIRLGDSMFYVEVLVDSAVMISISFTALMVGLMMKSSKATIIAGMIIVCLTQGNIGVYTLAGNIPFYITLLMLSAVSVFLSLYKLETRDVL